MRRAAVPDTLDGFRALARDLLAEGVSPDGVAWDDGVQPVLPGLGAPAPARAGGRAPRVPRAFVALADDVVLHRDPGRGELLYRVLWRLTHGEPELLHVPADPDVARLEVMRRAVQKDEHRMHAFVRFRRVSLDGDDHYVAWYRPDHRILRRGAPFFVDRFRIQRWSILTPDEAVSWDLEALRWGPGVPRPPTGDDEIEELWCAYYAAVFDPARANPRALRAELPARFFPGLPEARQVPDLLARAAPRVGAMLAATPGGAARFVPAARELPVLRAAARTCAACDLCGPATQTVFGEGPAPAPIMLVGEQPGDQEDRAGRPFVGPAGQVLDDALVTAGLARESLYLTNAVKHFRFEERGKNRIHQKPRAIEVSACHPWLEAEIEAVRPRVIVCLGATAAQSFLGPEFRLTRERGRVRETRWAPAWLATYHPAAILRLPPGAAADAARALIDDLRLAARHAG